MLCIHSNSSREEENTSLGFVFVVLEKASFGREAFFAWGAKVGLQDRDVFLGGD